MGSLPLLGAGSATGGSGGSPFVVNTAVDSSGVALYQTTGNHGLAVGDPITVVGTSVAGYNTIQSVTVLVSSTQFKTDLVSTGFASATGGTWHRFTPTDLTLNSWYDASQETTYANNDPVGSATDWSGLARPALNTLTLRPLFKTNIQGGLPAFLFDGVNDYLQASYARNQPQTVFQLSKLLASGASRLWDGVNATFGGIVVSGTLMVVNAGTSLSLGDIGTTDFHRFGAVYNGATSSIQKDADAAVTGDAGANNPVGVTLGAAFNGSQPSNCYIGEHINATGALVPRIVTATLNYMKLKWGMV